MFVEKKEWLKYCSQRNLKPEKNKHMPVKMAVSDLVILFFCHVIVLCKSMQILFHGRMRILKIGKQIQRQKNNRHIFNCNNASHQITSVNCTPLATKKTCHSKATLVLPAFGQWSTGSTPIRFVSHHKSWSAFGLSNHFTLPLQRVPRNQKMGKKNSWWKSFHHLPSKIAMRPFQTNLKNNTKKIYIYIYIYLFKHTKDM